MVLCNWSISYITNRKQSIAGNKSDIRNVTHEGCHRISFGTTTVPNLCEQYSDINPRRKQNKLLADDTNIFINRKTFRELNDRANKCMIKHNDWYEQINSASILIKLVIQLNESAYCYGRLCMCLCVCV
jgi:hypothetical protein